VLAAIQQPVVKAALAREGTEVLISSSLGNFANFLAENENSGCIWSGTLV
jgi:hypothetical protein